MWKFVRPQLACQAYLSKAVWPLSYICTKSTSLNCSSGESDTAALKTICFNLDITGTSHNAYSHLPFKLSHCKGRTGPTLYLKHNFLVCTTTGSTKANLVLCTSGTSLVCNQQQPPPNPTCMHKKKSTWTSQCTVHFWNKRNYLYGRHKQPGKFLIQSYICFSI